MDAALSDVDLPLKRHLRDVAEPMAAELASGFAFLERSEKQGGILIGMKSH